MVVGRRRPHGRTPCRDCGVDVLPRTLRGYARVGRCEVYMVHDEVWTAAGGPPSPTPERPEPTDFYLCVGCLEGRLGRRLTPGDFEDVGLNDDGLADTPRLRDRKGTGRNVVARLGVALELVLDFDCDVAVVAGLLRLDQVFLARQAAMFREVGDSDVA